MFIQNIYKLKIVLYSKYQILNFVMEGKYKTLFKFLVTKKCESYGMILRQAPQVELLIMLNYTNQIKKVTNAFHMKMVHR